jgi:nucleotide-binding universal stress UspA family protein
MFKTIIVGVDGHEGGRDALALADRLAQSFGGEIVAVHAYPYDYFVGRGADREFEAAMRQGAMETLETELSHAGVAAHPVVVSDDSPGRALHRTAELEDGDLIVVGSAHRGRIGRVLAGDHATGALHGAPCAVLVAPRGYAARGAKLETIGVGFDGSPEARAALAVARAIAEAAGARMRVIEVVAPTEPGGPFAGYQRDWVEHARIKREDAEERLAAILSELGDIATGDLAFGDPARELAYEANHLDMLVTGSRGYGPVRRLMLGSTSHKLVHEAPCPVLVLTRTAVEHGEEPEALSTKAQTS